MAKVPYYWTRHGDVLQDFPCQIETLTVFKRTVHFSLEIPHMLEYAPMHCPIERLALGVFGGPKGLESIFFFQGLFCFLWLKERSVPPERGKSARALERCGFLSQSRSHWTARHRLGLGPLQPAPARFDVKKHINLVNVPPPTPSHSHTLITAIWSEGASE